MSVLTPQCSVCCRRLSRLGLSSWAPGQIQVRGKKKNAKKPTHISVKLLSDMAAYGRKGRIVPISAGRMRIDFFPRGIADYLTLLELKELKRSETAVTRDRSYGKIDMTNDLIGDGARKAGSGLLGMGKRSRTLSSEPVRRVGLDMLKPEVAFERLAKLLPSRFDFYRTPILDPPPSPEMSNEVTDATKVPQHDAQSPNPSPHSSTSIYGSVATMDVSIAIKGLLAESDLAGSVVIEAEQIRFVRKQTEDGEVDRVKMLGEYEVEIKVKGYGEAMRRKVRVLAEDQRRPRTGMAVGTTR